MAVRTAVLLPSAALAVMLGIVFVVNMHRYGWIGAVGGIVLLAGGIALGIRVFKQPPKEIFRS